MTDIGGDPDDQQSMVRLMCYANAFEIEGLVATSSGTPGERANATPRPDLIHQIVNAYGEVRQKLAQHETGWPDADALRQVIKRGQVARGRAAIGQQHDTEASLWIMQRVDAGSPADPLNISIWGGQTDLAQALWRVRQERGEKGLAEFVTKFRAYDIADQDRLADWMASEFPGMFYILSKAPEGQDKRDASFRGVYLTGDETLTSREWMEQHVLSTGPLGALYPTKTWTDPNPHGCMKEGDTPAWFFFLPQGGNDPSDPSKPGWGGQYQRSADGWWRDIPRREGFDARDTVSRWRPAFQRDFAKRIGWTK